MRFELKNNGLSLFAILICVVSFSLFNSAYAQGPVNVYVDVIELNHGYDCGNDGALGDDPDPRWKFWGGHSGGNWVYYGCYNGGSRACGVYNNPDFDLINVTNTTATQINVDMESWEEDGCGGDCDANTCTFNDDDCRSGRARILDINFRRDAPTTYNQSGWGYRGCSYGARVDVYYECLDWGNQTDYGSNSWRGYVYDGTGFNTYMGYITENETFDNSFNGDTDTDWYATSCREFQKSSFSIRYKMRKDFACGYYTFTVGSDDGIRLSIDGGNTWIINQWIDRGYVTNSSASIFLSGSTDLVLEYYENTGGNRCSFTYSYTPYTPPGNPATFGNNSWNVYGYIGQNYDLSGVTYRGYYTDNNLSFNTANYFCTTCAPSTASGWQGCHVTEDNHTVVAKRQGFPCGTYTLNMPYHDDEAKVFIDGVEVFSHLGCCDVHNAFWSGNLTPYSTVEIRYAEGGGGNGVQVDFVLTGNSVQGNPSVYGSGLWNVYAWWAGDAAGGSGAWSANYSGYYTINSLSFDTRAGYPNSINTWDQTTQSPSNAPGYVGCYVGPDNHSYAFKRQGFPCGYYQINLPNHDDRAVVFVNGTQVADFVACCATETNVWQGFLHSGSTIELRISEGGGGSHGSLELVKLYDLGITSSNAAMNCTDPARALTANVAGGSWSGNGVLGSSFYPATAGVGTHTITYTLNGCTATQQITVSAPGNPAAWGINSWNVNAYNGSNFNTYYGYYNVNSLNINTQNQWSNLGSPSDAVGYQGCTVPIDNHSYKIRRQGFPCGIYNIAIMHDDNYVLTINGVQVGTGTCCTNALTNVATGVWLNGSSTIELTIEEGGGNSFGVLDFTKTGDLTITSSNAAMNCSDAARALTANLAGGTFTGPGVSGSSFSPASAGLGTHTITYTLNGCTATQQITVSALGNPAVFGNNQWNVYAYNAGDDVGGSGAFTNNYSGYYTTASLSFDTRTGQTYSNAQSWTNTPSEASGYVGCPVGADNHSWTAKRTNFSCGLYRIRILGHDDMAQLYVDGVKVYETTMHSAAATNPLTYPYTAWMGELSASSTVEFRSSEGGGVSWGGIEVVQVTNPGISVTVNKTDANCNGSNDGTVTAVLSGGVSNARLVRITQKNNDAINLAELQVFDLNGNNVALASNGATATLSSTLAGYPASNLIDGNTGNFAHSDNQTDYRGQYIQVLLPASTQIDYLRLYNRTDCCQFRGSNLLIEVFADAAGTNLLFGKTVDANATYPTPVTINMLDISWNNGPTVLSQSNLAPATYTATVNNAAYCGGGSGSGSATVGQPALVSMSASIVHESCIGNADGAIDITPAGGTPGYTYNWSNGPVGQDITGLAAGGYNVTVTDAHGCTGTGNYTVTVTPAIVNTISGGGAALCNYGDPTSIGGNITGGTGTYAIQWQVSTDGSNYSNIGGANSSSYDPGQITQTTWYRRVVDSGPCTEISNAIQITVTYQTTLTWTGAINTNWHVDGNWDCGHVPTSTQDVVIPAAPVNQPEILSGNIGECNSINVQTGANVTVRGNGRLDVNR